MHTTSNPIGQHGTSTSSDIVHSTIWCIILTVFIISLYIYDIRYSNVTRDDVSWDIPMRKQIIKGEQVRDLILIWLRNISHPPYLISYLTTLSLCVATNNILGYKTPLFVLDFSQYVRMELTQCIRYAEIENRTIRLYLRMFATRI